LDSFLHFLVHVECDLCVDYQVIEVMHHISPLAFNVLKPYLTLVCLQGSSDEKPKRRTTRYSQLVFIHHTLSVFRASP